MTLQVTTACLDPQKGSRRFDNHWFLLIRRRKCTWYRTNHPANAYLFLHKHARSAGSRAPCWCCAPATWRTEGWRSSFPTDSVLRVSCYHYWKERHFQDEDYLLSGLSLSWPVPSAVAFCRNLVTHPTYKKSKYLVLNIRIIWKSEDIHNYMDSLKKLYEESITKIQYMHIKMHEKWNQFTETLREKAIIAPKEQPAGRSQQKNLIR